MFDRIKKARANEGGFTLVELLIVIVILGILSAVVVFSVTGITDRGDKSACLATRTSVLTAAQSAYAQEGAYPASVALLVSGGWLDAGGAVISGSNIKDKATNNKWSLDYSINAGPPASVTVSACP